MKIEKVNDGSFFVLDERVNMSFFAKTKEGAEEGLKKLGYQKGASDNCWRIPGDIILDEDQRA
ncbi:MAG: hypothetical protein AAB822_02720 [Patescibacteria group bacterium]